MVSSPQLAASTPYVEELEDLALVRRELAELLRLQETSILYFARTDVGDEDSAGPGSFFRTVEDRREQAAATGSRLTTTVTCIESLLEVPRWKIRSPDADPSALLNRLESFVTRHLDSDDPEHVWMSDDAAWVYCRVRTLGSYLRLSEAVAQPEYAHSAKVLERATEAWESRYKHGASFGLREAAAYFGTQKFRDATEKEHWDQQYPANAYLTYWGLLMRRGLARMPTVNLKALGAPMDEHADEAARTWLIENLGTQVAFRYNKSPSADPQQLLWSVCGLVRFARPDTFASVQSTARELLVAGLRAFFAQMDDNGDWVIGAPLFHYRNAGNAYSYIYETLGELLHLATAAATEVHERSSAALREELRPYWPKLKIMLARARQLGQPLEPDVRVWSSGHHPHRTAESWATASVFRMLQSLRRLVGVWCAEETERALGARFPHWGEKDLLERGESWNTGEGSVGLYLRLAFLWPIQQRAQIVSAAPVDRIYARDRDDPFLDDEDQARSAILFGPPGTSKTTMVEALAGALGWKFIEVTPARFIDRGMDFVSAKADQLFRQIMEVDHCVVLLDEIDELIQLRGTEADPMERFFTTTMLPRLAALWARGRVLFFVNTNDIERVDIAIRRAQRFDAALLVLPPSYAVKKKMLAEQDTSIDVPWTHEDVNSRLEAVNPRRQATAQSEERAEDAKGEPEVPLINPGWFALMRFDQIDTFAATYQRAVSGGDDPEGAANTALERVALELMRLDWLPRDDQPELGKHAAEDERRPSLSDLPPLLGRLLGSERRDGRRRFVWKTTDGTFESLPPGTEDPQAWLQDRQLAVDPTSGCCEPTDNNKSS
jgi:hypothetical protein